ncbi:hypothetical protein AAG570_013468 [Ranatra chinensis]|uniref:Uncharacterized protein n=1 Tax=Ranatra chinensis TaxID=642074 RepID=A0ABD0YCX8_9HEMI
MASKRRNMFYGTRSWRRRKLISLGLFADNVVSYPNVLRAGVSGAAGADPPISWKFRWSGLPEDVISERQLPDWQIVESTPGLPADSTFGVPGGNVIRKHLGVSAMVRSILSVGRNCPLFSSSELLIITGGGHHAARSNTYILEREDTGNETNNTWSSQLSSVEDIRIKFQDPIADEDGDQMKTIQSEKIGIGALLVGSGGVAEAGHDLEAGRVASEPAED